MVAEYRPGMIVLSYVQADVLLKARKAGSGVIEVSPDLGISNVTVDMSDEGVVFPSGERLSWQQVGKIKQADVNCFAVEGDEIRAIMVFSEATNRMCSLLPTKRTPSMLIAGITALLALC